MNKYALIAQEHWQKHAPTRYAALENPEEFFEELGESAAVQIDQVASSLERQLPQDLPYLERVGQMQAIRLQAEETVLTDLVYSVESESTSLAAELEEMLSDLPTPAAIQAAIDQLHEEAADQSEQEGFSTSSMTSDQTARLQRLEALLPLVTMDEDPEQMPEPALRDRILALRPYWDPQTHSLATS